MELLLENIVEKSKKLLKRYQQLQQEHANLKQQLAALESEHEHLKKKAQGDKGYLDLADQMVHNEVHDD